MRHYLLCYFALFALASPVAAQTHEVSTLAQLKQWQRAAPLRGAWRVPADSMARWTRQGPINLDYLQQLAPAWLGTDSQWMQAPPLPTGHYVWVRMQDHQVMASTHISSGLSFQSMPHGRQVRLAVFDQQGQVPTNLQARLGKRWLHWSTASQAFKLKRRHRDMDEQQLQIYTPGDTLIGSLSFDVYEPYRYRNRRRWQQWPVVRQVRRAGIAVRNLFNGSYQQRRQASREPASFMVFNKPLYKKGDTLRLKAWATTPKGQPLTMPMAVSIHYNFRGASKTVRLDTLRPVHPGSYVYSWPLPDSLPADIRYNVYLSSLEKKPRTVNGQFSTEEYVLPDVSKFEVNTASQWLRKDSLPISLTATDANGLYLPDGRVSLYLLNTQVNRFYDQRLFVPDTLWQRSLPLQTDGPTTVQVPALALPNADLDLRLVAVLRNSSNEMKVEEKQLKHLAVQKEIKFDRDSQYLHISYVENGEVQTVKAELNYSSELVDYDTVLQLPARLPIHPLAEEYDVTILDELGRRQLNKSYKIEAENFEPTLSSDNNADSIGFQLHNPGGMPVWISVMHNRRTLWQQRTSQTHFRWAQRKSKRRMYTAVINYYYRGEPQNRQVQMGVYYQILQVAAQVQPAVQPGATDSLAVTVTDYRNRPVANANITATGQNAQLQNRFVYPSFPYNMRYDKQRRWQAPKPYEADEAYCKTDSIAAHFPALLRQLGADTLPYYRRLTDTLGWHLVRSAHQRVYPELAVHLHHRGKPVPAYILYINNQPADMFWRNSQRPNSHLQYFGFVKLSIRTWNQLLHIDSIYLQPHYKHDLFVNVATAGSQANARAINMPDTLRREEKDQLANYFIQLVGDRMTDAAWLWSSSEQQVLVGSSHYIAGPFLPGDSLRLYNERRIDIKFPFEKNYEYRLTPGMVRLERKPLLAGRTPLRNTSSSWQLADTTWQYDLPLLIAAKPDYRRQFSTTRMQYNSSAGMARLQLQWQKDSAIRYSMLLPVATPTDVRVVAGASRHFHQLLPGRYLLVVVNDRDEAWTSDTLDLPAYGISALQLGRLVFSRNNAEARAIYDRQVAPLQEEVEPPAPSPVLPTTAPVALPVGIGSVSGTITDAHSGLPLAGVTVMIKGTKKATSTNAQGVYSLEQLPDGIYQLLVQFVGYNSKELSVTVNRLGTQLKDVTLSPAATRLDEVVVVGYSTRLKRDFTGSVTRVENMLQGRAAGVAITNDVRVQIRGISSVADNTQPLIVVDGVAMEELPANLDTTGMRIDILKEAAATAIYGSRGAHGVIVISTGKNVQPVIRTIFRDDAYWAPSTQTNADGKAVIPIRYPENITSWQHMVYAAARGRRYGAAYPVTKAFKMLQGTLQMPAFALAGDTVLISGKALNYASDTRQISGLFSYRGQQQSSQHSVASGSAATALFAAGAPAAGDTMQISWQVTDERGLQDGEQRRSPVLPVGTLDTRGTFFIAGSTDTSWQVAPLLDSGRITLHAQNNLLDVLEKELERLKDYPQACMEQTANKMWGLLMMKRIYKQLQKPFKHDALIDKLNQRLLRFQDYSGGWPWWESGQPNLYISTRVLQALRHADTSAANQRAIREALLYLQNKLRTLPQHEKLEALLAMSEAGHLYPYGPALDSIPFDSLSLHERWQMVRIMQKSGMAYQAQLQKLWKQRNENFLGSISWGTEGWYWHNNVQASTVLAGKVLRSDTAWRRYWPQVQQYFIAHKRQGWYNNTVEQAEIVALLLDDALAQQVRRPEPAVLQVNEQRISQFPATLQLPAGPVRLRKQGAGLLYVGLSQQQWVVPQRPKDSLFAISTELQWHGKPAAQWQVPAGERVQLKVTINAAKSADFVQIDIPIPAGCIYAMRPQPWGEHREYLKDRVVLYTERLSAGTHTYVLDLETRFSGRFQLNPARVSLMYFPQYEGYNRVETVRIAETN